MTTFYLIGKLAESPRGKRLLKSLGATPTAEPPTGTGFVTAQVVGRASRLSGGRLALGPHAGETPGTAGETPAPLPEQLPGFCLATGQDYQTRTPAEQRQWLAWAARPGCVLLLVPPFQTAVRHEPNGWGMASLEKTPGLDVTAHPVLRLTLVEMNVSVARGLTRTLNSALDGPTAPQLGGLFRKHPDSGIFAVTAVPVWSLALADYVPALTEWLAAWLTLAGHPADAARPASPRAFEPTQSHYSVLLYLASGKFSSRAAALESLAWNDTFELSREDVPSLLDDLEAAELIAAGALSETGRRTLLESPYRRYAEVYLSPSSKL